MTTETRCLKKAYRDTKGTDRPSFKAWVRDLAVFGDVVTQKRDMDAARTWLLAKGMR